ncbi:MAG: Alkaline phosphatase like protein [uncultured Rubrobacteraceae bacterium]|uniref:TVP38/TMEM64 family membrane protein n=1 Tax=uncultured Rubrobacteraceae bacterium TaxID=349277 RepID=A0A6J4PD48_9ACTN|nr:MAG: Alkaline phosphatase like protein [uncultured Rubrobacteraceae bacterium]
MSRPTEPNGRAVRRLRLWALLGAALGFGLLYGLVDGFREETNRALGILGRGDVAGLRDYILSFGIWAPVVSCFLMVLQALAAPVPSFLITFANGLAFGVFWGWMLSLFGHVLAAAVCFGVSRTLGRGPVEALVGRTGLESADRWFERWGTYAVFAGRLVPGVAFDAISYAAGLTRMRFGGFVLATTLGILPQTFLYSYLGQRAPEYVGLFLVTSALVVVGVLVFAIVRRGKRGPGRLEG